MKNKNNAMNDEGGKREQTESSDCCPDGGDIPEPLRIRYLIQNSFGFDRLLLAYNWVFSPGLSLILWALFLAFR